MHLLQFEIFYSTISIIAWRENTYSNEVHQQDGEGVIYNTDQWNYVTGGNRKMINALSTLPPSSFKMYVIAIIYRREFLLRNVFAFYVILYAESRY